MGNIGDDTPGPGPDPITPAEEEDDDVFESEPTTPAEIEASSNKRRSQSLSALHTKDPQSPLKVINYIHLHTERIIYDKSPSISLSRQKTFFYRNFTTFHHL